MKAKPERGIAMTRKVIEGVLYPPDKPVDRAKIIPVWHVEWATGGLPRVTVAESFDEARSHADWLLVGGCESQFIAITGPHQQRVPA